MSLLRSFCTPYGAPGRLYYDSCEFFKCGPQADLRAWRKLAVPFFAQQIQIGNSLGWFLTLWTTHSCKNQLVANFFPDILHYSLTNWKVSDEVISRIEGDKYLENKNKHIVYLWFHPYVAKKKFINLIFL